MKKTVITIAAVISHMWKLAIVSVLLVCSISTAAGQFWSNKQPDLLPEEEALEALLDRFLIRVKCENVDPEELEKVLLAGWRLDERSKNEKPTITPSQIISMQSDAKKVDLSLILNDYLNLIHSMRNAGVKVSDRRAVKFQNLIAGSAFISGRDYAILSDLWVLKYTWDTEEQIDILAGLVNTFIEKDKEELKHPQANVAQRPDAEQLLSEIEALAEKIADEKTAYEEKKIIKEKLRYVQARSKWIQDASHKVTLQNKIDALWQTLLETAQ